MASAVCNGTLYRGGVAGRALAWRVGGAAGGLLARHGRGVARGDGDDDDDRNEDEDEVDDDGDDDGERRTVVGLPDGRWLGVSVGPRVGRSLGTAVGWRVGMVLGPRVGCRGRYKSNASVIEASLGLTVTLAAWLCQSDSPPLRAPVPLRLSRVRLTISVGLMVGGREGAREGVTVGTTLGPVDGA
jgi:hypothetical protein